MTLVATVQLYIGVILAFKWERVVEFLPASILIVRFGLCFLIFDLIDNNETLEDKKKMRDSIVLALLPLLTTFSSNTRIELFFTIPLGIVSNAIMMRHSLENDG